MRRSKHRKKSYSWIFFTVTVLILLVACIAFLILMRVERVSVRGNYYSNRETVIGRVFQNEDDYRLYRVLWKQLFGTGEKEAFSSCTVRLTGVQSAEITVVETEAVCQMVLGESHVFLNRNGIVLGSGAGSADLLMELGGFTVLSVSELEPIRVNNPSALLEGIEVILALKEQNVRVKSVLYEDGTFSAVIGQVTVLLGTTENIRGKAAELSGQAASFQGLKGIMHLENYLNDDDQKRFYFEVTP